MYLLGAVIAHEQDCEPFRDALRGLLNAGRKLHWRDLRPAERSRAISVIAAFDLAHIVVIGTPVNAKGQERARAQCLERLAWELHEEGVESLVLEARPDALMKRDLRTIDGLRGRHGLPRGLHVTHGLPSTDPMLWIPDQVLGALGDFVTGSTNLFTQVKSTTRIIELDP